MTTRLDEKSFKLTSNSLDNPTEITRSDVNDVITALMDANAYTILHMLEGEDKFGKMCAELKLSLIDLEAEVIN